MDRGGTLLEQLHLTRYCHPKLWNARKGQFTLFIILGIVMLAAFGFALYARTLIVRTQLDTQASKMVGDALDTTPITYYVTRCLDDATKDAIATSMLQGGRIYDFQGGLTPFHLLDENVAWMNISVPEYDSTYYIVPYGIRQQKDPACVDAPTPDYPYVASPAMMWAQDYATHCIYRTNESYFGASTLPKLCDSNGPNRNGGITCQVSLYGMSETVQQQLEIYIANKTRACVNFSIFSNTLGNDNISVNNVPNVTFTFAKQGSLISASYPFTVYIHGSIPVVKMVSFQVGSNVALKEFYTFIYSLASNEISNYTFNFFENYNSINYFALLPHPNETYITRTSNICPGCVGSGPETGEEADLATIRDNGTEINGHALMFTALIENRWPALDYIHATSVGSPFDLSVKEGERIYISPQGYDPDDTTLSYKYAGWKETEDSVFNIACCSEPGNDCATNPFACTTIFTPPDINAPHNWTRSSEYQSTGRVASYLTIPGDAGWHEVIVQVYKRGQLFDAQTVKILVFDTPKAVAKGHSIYTDILDTDASVEDPYILDGSASTASWLGSHLPITSLVWTDAQDPFRIPASPSDTLTNNIITLPYSNTQGAPPSIAPYGILDTKPQAGTDTLAFTSNLIGIHHIGLVVTDSGGATSAPAILDVIVHQCLPHHDLSILPWPYNNLPATDPEAFQGDHTCCSDTFNLLDSSTQCYHETVYGGLDALDALDTSNTDKYPALANPITYNGLTGKPALGDTSRNDVFMRTFTRSCDNTRGNICSGNAQEERTTQLNCEDNGNLLTGRVCSGPSDGTQTNSADATCINYPPGDNFARHIGLTSETACDTTLRQSSVGTGGYDNSGGVYSCKGSCNGGTSACDSTLVQDCTCSVGNFCDNLLATAAQSGSCYTTTAGTHWCTSTCTASKTDESPQACKCEHPATVKTATTPSSPMFCTNPGDTNCYAPQNGAYISGTAGCCEPGDTYQVSASPPSWCINGVLQNDPELYAPVCESHFGLGHWFSTVGSGTCCNTPTDNFFGLSGYAPLSTPAPRCCFGGGLSNAGQIQPGSHLLCDASGIFYCGVQVNTPGYASYVIPGKSVGSHPCNPNAGGGSWS